MGCGQVETTENPSTPVHKKATVTPKFYSKPKCQITKLTNISRRNSVGNGKAFGVSKSISLRTGHDWHRQQRMPRPPLRSVI